MITWALRADIDGRQSDPLSSVRDAGIVPAKLGGLREEIVVTGVFQTAAPNERELNTRGTRGQRQKDDVPLVSTS
jgi:hypothetical protein